MFMYMKVFMLVYWSDNTINLYFLAKLQLCLLSVLHLTADTIVTGAPIFGCLLFVVVVKTKFHFL